MAKNPRSVRVVDLPTTKEGHFLRVEVSFDDGGMNYFTGERGHKGYYVSVQPIEKNDFSVSFLLFSGLKAFVAEATRFNHRKLQAIAATALNLDEYQKCLAAVLAKHPEVTLVEPVAA